MGAVLCHLNQGLLLGKRGGVGCCLAIPGEQKLLPTCLALECCLHLSCFSLFPEVLLGTNGQAS